MMRFNPFLAYLTLCLGTLVAIIMAILNVMPEGAPAPQLYTTEEALANMDDLFHARFGFNSNPLQRQAMITVVGNNEDLLVSSSTSSGKSGCALGSLTLMEAIDPKAWAIIVSPLMSLNGDLAQKCESLQFRVCKVTSDLSEKQFNECFQKSIEGSIRCCHSHA